LKVIVLGGSGDMGRKAVEELCKFDEITSIGVAGRNLDKCQRVVASIPDPKGKLLPISIDVSRDDSLLDLLDKFNVVASAVGPFYRFEKRLAEMAIKAGADYVSLCDDYDAANEVLKLNQFAQERGVRVITGLGWTPGISSVFARDGFDSLESTEKINISWAGNSGDSPGMAVILHVMHAFSGHVPSFQQGQDVTVRAGSERTKIEFLPPIGDIYVYHVGHPEPVTMPKYFPGVKEVTLKGGVNEDFLNRLTIAVEKLGVLRIQRFRNGLAKLFKKTMPVLRRLGGVGSEYSGVRVDLIGTKHGKKYKLIYNAVGPMEVLTGVPLALGARSLACGEIEPLGVLAPEAPGVIDTQKFISEIQSRGVNFQKEEMYL
jgi:lysine 6-dehydrogenase